MRRKKMMTLVVNCKTLNEQSENELQKRLCRNYELTFDSAEQIVKIAATRLLLKKIKQALNL